LICHQGWALPQAPFLGCKLFFENLGSLLTVALQGKVNEMCAASIVAE